MCLVICLEWLFAPARGGFAFHVGFIQKPGAGRTCARAAPAFGLRPGCGGFPAGPDGQFKRHGFGNELFLRMTFPAPASDIFRKPFWFHPPLTDRSRLIAPFAPFGHNSLSFVFGAVFGGLEHFVMLSFVDAFLDGLDFGFVVGGEYGFYFPSGGHGRITHTAGHDAGIVNGGVPGIVTDQFFLGLNAVRSGDTIRVAPVDKRQLTRAIFNHILCHRSFDNTAVRVTISIRLSSIG
jgi:hypothetical protein